MEVFTIKGLPAETAAAGQKILEAIQTEWSSGTREVTISIHVPSDLVQSLLGENQSALKHISRSTWTHIEVSQETGGPSTSSASTDENLTGSSDESLDSEASAEVTVLCRPPLAAIQKQTTAPAPSPTEAKNLNDPEAAEPPVKTVETIETQTTNFINKLFRSKTPAKFEYQIHKLCQVKLEGDENRISFLVKALFGIAFGPGTVSTDAVFIARVLQRLIQHHKGSSFEPQLRQFVLVEFQQELDKIDRKPADLEKSGYSAKEEALLKHQMCAFAIFGGKLFVYELLTTKLMVESALILLRLDGPDLYNRVRANDECIESLCFLLKNIGEVLEKKLNRSSVARFKSPDREQIAFIPGSQWMEKMFVELGKMAKDLDFQARTHYNLLKIIRFRRNGWKE